MSDAVVLQNITIRLIHRAAAIHGCPVPPGQHTVLRRLFGLPSEPTDVGTEIAASETAQIGGDLVGLPFES